MQHRRQRCIFCVWPAARIDRSAAMSFQAVCAWFFDLAQEVTVILG